MVQKEIEQTIKRLDKAKSLENIYFELHKLKLKQWANLPINFDSQYEDKKLYKHAKDLLKKSNYHRKRVIDLEYELKKLEK